MALPMTRGEFNRLGDRLIAHQTPSEADLAELATALGAYQQVLELVKAHLHDLGFAPTGRVKTTTTMTDKLRRTQGMQLSRVQDLAGARITVRNLAAQDDAKDRIGAFYTAQASRLREIDRRVDPRFGYRAVHLVVYVDELPVEIQIRTELQDSWAQIFERLADRWGRGIRYGQAPENPEAIVRSDQIVFTRGEIVERLMRLSDYIWSFERNRRGMDATEQTQATLDALWAKVRSSDSPELLARKLPPEMVSARDRVITLQATFAAMEGVELEAELVAEFQELSTIPVADLIVGQLRRMTGIHFDLFKAYQRQISAVVAEQEAAVRDILRLIAGARDEGV
jgi:ppGpp synthetase/RelA/SpoT-type nucleotidyltranferase